MFNFEGVQTLSAISAVIAKRVHLFPFRTQKLSYAVPKILGGRLPGKIGQGGHRETKVLRRESSLKTE